MCRQFSRMGRRCLFVRCGIPIQLDTRLRRTLTSERNRGRCIKRKRPRTHLSFGRPERVRDVSELTDSIRTDGRHDAATVLALTRRAFFENGGIGLGEIASVRGGLTEASFLPGVMARI